MPDMTEDVAIQGVGTTTGYKAKEQREYGDDTEFIARKKKKGAKWCGTKLRRDSGQLFSHMTGGLRQSPQPTTFMHQLGVERHEYIYFALMNVPPKDPT